METEIQTISFFGKYVTKPLTEIHACELVQSMACLYCKL